MRFSCWRHACLMALCVAAAVTGMYAVHVSSAQACGGFFSPREGGRRPSLAYEQTLIVFDPAQHREHFVREVVFTASKRPFGFVVPTPSRPEVAPVRKSPFDELRTRFPFEPPRRREPGDEMAAGGRMGPVEPAGVEVLQVSRVGSFTAFVLAASEQSAFNGWLKKNGFVSTPETSAWIAHYVKLGFYYVAMRYEPPRPDSPETASVPTTKSETVRISFDSPLPYYPYFEPDQAPGERPQSDRELWVWLASPITFVPVAARERDKEIQWVRPLAAGTRFATARSGLEIALGDDAKILPAGAEIGVQRFMDQKGSREGFGDIVFVPTETQVVDPAARARLLALARVLDPALEQVTP